MIILFLLPSLKPFYVGLVSIKGCTQYILNELAFLKGLGKKQTKPHQQEDCSILYLTINSSAGGTTSAVVRRRCLSFRGGGIWKRILAHQPNSKSPFLHSNPTPRVGLADV